jgi:CRP-like cAMP-binding protein
LPLHHFTTLVELKPGDGLYNEGDPLGGLERGLFFIECGVIKVEYATGATATRGTLRRSGSFNNHSASLGNYNDSLTKIQSTSLTQYSSLLSSGGDSRTFRLARIGPGWVAGTTEYISGMRQLGDHIAVTHCRLHHLPYSRLQEIEKSNPSLVLSLYKLLSYLMAKRQGATIGQLATLHSIMTSPAQLRSFG